VSFSVLVAVIYLRDLITYGEFRMLTTTSKIIFIGDPAQLPPIGMNFSPALDPKYLKRDI
jgi:hypothetical protein